jgi:uncharacterized protein
MIMTATFTNNRQRNTFELDTGNGVAFATYQRQGDSHYFLNYVEAPAQLRGTGAAGQLMEQIMAFMQDHHAKVTPVCPYAVAWLRRHPAYTRWVEDDHF